MEIFEKQKFCGQVRAALAGRGIISFQFAPRPPAKRGQLKH